jgi:hypothetical protein
MNPEVKAKWVAALRNPEAKQTKNCLRDENGFCCLGILTDIYIKEHGLDWDDEKDAGRYQYLGWYSTLPSVVKTWAGVKDNVAGSVEAPPKLTENTLVNTDGTCLLTTLNDNGITFLQIADLIEEQL